MTLSSALNVKVQIFKFNVAIVRRVWRYQSGNQNP